MTKSLANDYELELGHPDLGTSWEKRCTTGRVEDTALGKCCRAPSFGLRGGLPRLPRVFKQLVSDSYAVLSGHGVVST